LLSKLPLDGFICVVNGEEEEIEFLGLGEIGTTDGETERLESAGVAADCARDVGFCGLEVRVGAGEETLDFVYGAGLRGRGLAFPSDQPRIHDELAGGGGYLEAPVDMMGVSC
jgi:hypothetical protein